MIANVSVVPTKNPVMAAVFREDMLMMAIQKVVRKQWRQKRHWWESLVEDRREGHMTVLKPLKLLSSRVVTLSQSNVEAKQSWRPTTTMM